MEADQGLSTQRYPFAYDPAEPFVSRLGEWVADVFYDILPESGFEVRDEQILWRTSSNGPMEIKDHYG